MGIINYRVIIINLFHIGNHPANYSIYCRNMLLFIKLCKGISNCAVVVHNFRQSSFQYNLQFKFTLPIAIGRVYFVISLKNKSTFIIIIIIIIIKRKKCEKRKLFHS